MTGGITTTLTNAAAAPLPMLVRYPSPLKGYVFEDAQHVIYIAEDGHLHEVIWERFSWGHNPVTSSLNNVPANSGGPIYAGAT